MSMMPYMSNEDIAIELLEYDEHSFDQLPDWLRLKVQSNSLVFTRRLPTEQEIEETILDAKEHRKYNKERNLTDILERYKRRN